MKARDIETKAFPIGRRGYEKDAVDSYLQEVAAAFRALEEQDRTEAPEAAPAPPSFQDVGSQVSAILATAAAAAEEMKATAQREAEAIRAAAAEETESARRSLADQLTNADQITSRAEEEAAATLATAREEAQRLQDEARQRAAAMEREAAERAAALERNTVASVEAMLADGTKQYERLRDLREQTAERLASVEATIRKAREECSDDIARNAFKVARKAVAAAKRDDGAGDGAPRPDGRKAARGPANRRPAAAARSATAAAPKPARTARARPS